MPKSNRKSKAKKESKTSKLNQISQECRGIEKKLDENDKTIASLESQYQVDTTSRKAYQKSTYQKLSKAYNKRDSLSAELQQKQIEYNTIEAEPESSSSDESKKSRSSIGGEGSFRSSASAQIGWNCGDYRGGNVINPWGLNNICACGHQFCNDDNHYTV